MVQGVMRLPDWRARYAAEMDRQRRAGFGWGGQDCLLGLVAGATLALCGDDLWGRWRGRYTTAAGALRVMRNDGFACLADGVASVLPEIHPIRARIGDVAAIATEDGFGQTLGLFDASGLIVMSPAGHGRVPRAQAVRAFRVG